MPESDPMASAPHEDGLTVTSYEGRRISYFDTGRGLPLVFLPPGASSGRAWRRVTDALRGDFEANSPASYRVLAVNPSGYEATATFAGTSPLGLDDEARAVVRMMDRAGLSHGHLIGHSYGGAIALRMMLNWPARFESLFLIEPAAYPLLEEAGERDLAAEVETVNRDYIERVRRGEHENALARYIDYYNASPGNRSPRSWDAMPASSKARLVALAPTIASALAAAHDAPTRLADCAGIDIPATLVHGAMTDPVHRRVTELLAGVIPKARAKVVAQAGHMLSLTHPAAVADLLREHLARVPGQAEAHRAR